MNGVFQLPLQRRPSPVLRRSSAGPKPHQAMQPTPSDARPALILQCHREKGQGKPDTYLAVSDSHRNAKRKKCLNTVLIGTAAI